MVSLANERRRANSKANAANQSSAPQQGGRFASESDNIKNKARTAQLQGESTFEVRDNAGNIVRYDTPEVARNVSSDAFKKLSLTDQVKVKIAQNQALQQDIQQRRTNQQDIQRQKLENQKAIQAAKQNTAFVQSKVNAQKAKVAELQRTAQYWNSPAGEAASKKQYNGLSRAQKRKFESPGVSVGKALSAAQTELSKLEGSLVQSAYAEESVKKESAGFAITTAKRSAAGSTKTAYKPKVATTGTAAFATAAAKSSTITANPPSVADAGIPRTLGEVASQNKPVTFGPYIETQKQADVINDNRKEMQKEKDRSRMITASKVTSITGLDNVKIIRDAAKQIDKSFELDKLPQERSEKNIPIFGQTVVSLPSPKKVAGVLAPVSNFGVDVADLTKATVKHIQSGGKEGFIQDEKTGLPVAESYYYRTPTTFSKALSGEKINLKSDVLDQQTLGGDVTLLAAAVSSGVLGAPIKSTGPTHPFKNFKSETIQKPGSGSSGSSNVIKIEPTFGNIEGPIFPTLPKAEIPKLPSLKPDIPKLALPKQPEIEIPSYSYEPVIRDPISKKSTNSPHRSYQKPSSPAISEFATPIDLISGGSGKIVLTNAAVITPKISGKKMTAAQRKKLGENLNNIINLKLLEKGGYIEQNTFGSVIDQIRISDLKKLPITEGVKLGDIAEVKSAKDTRFFDAGSIVFTTRGTIGRTRFFDADHFVFESVKSVSLGEGKGTLPKTKKPDSNFRTFNIYKAKNEAGVKFLGAEEVETGKKIAFMGQEPFVKVKPDETPKLALPKIASIEQPTEFTKGKTFRFGRFEFTETRNQGVRKTTVKDLISGSERTQTYVPLGEGNAFPFTVIPKKDAKDFKAPSLNDMYKNFIKVDKSNEFEVFGPQPKGNQPGLKQKQKQIQKQEQKTELKLDLKSLEKQKTELSLFKQTPIALGEGKGFFLKPTSSQKDAFKNIPSIVGRTAIVIPGTGRIVKPSSAQKRKPKQDNVPFVGVIPDQTPGQTPTVTPDIIPDTVPDYPFGPRTTTPEIPPEIPGVPRSGGFFPYVPKISLSSWAGGPYGAVRSGYGAYGISEDIQIKTLPTFSRYSKSTKIFEAQRKEDKKIQALFYGKPKSKRSKSKSKPKPKSKKSNTRKKKKR